jgi:hypothetical protein
MKRKGKTTVTVRLKKELLDALKKKAKEHNCTLNQYVKWALLDTVYYTPNDETIAAMNEPSEESEPFDLDDLHNLIKSFKDEKDITVGAI